jgi:hypothetical protein
MNMSYYHDFEPYVEEFLDYGLGFSLLANSFSSLLSIAVYVLTALSLYTIAKRRGIKNPWLSWIPIGNAWLLGALSDHYRYITRGETRNKRKTLLILSIISLALTLCLALVGGILSVRVITMLITNRNAVDFAELGIQLVVLLALLTPVAIIAAVIAVVRFLALFDIFQSTDPRNRWLYLVLCLLSGYAQPLILFFNRNRDDGMPPRLTDTEVHPTP